MGVVDEPHTGNGPWCHNCGCEATPGNELARVGDGPWLCAECRKPVELSDEARKAMMPIMDALKERSADAA